MQNLIKNSLVGVKKSWIQFASLLFLIALSMGVFTMLNNVTAVMADAYDANLKTGLIYDYGGNLSRFKNYTTKLTEDSSLDECKYQTNEYDNLCLIRHITNKYNQDHQGFEMGVNFRKGYLYLNKDTGERTIIINSSAWTEQLRDDNGDPWNLSSTSGASEMNKEVIIEGKLPTENDSVQTAFISNNYAKLHNLKTGSKTKFLGSDFTVGGSGTFSEQIIPNFGPNAGIPIKSQTLLLLNKEGYCNYATDESLVNNGLCSVEQLNTHNISYDELADINYVYLRSLNRSAIPDLESLTTYFAEYFQGSNLLSDRTGVINNATYGVGTYVNQEKVYEQITYVILGVLIVLVAIVLFMVVKQIIRKNQTQFGVLKANGYQRSIITLCFLPYGVIPGFLGGGIGYFVGFGLQFLLVDQLALTVQIPLSGDVVSILAAIISFLVAGLLLSFLVFFLGYYLLRSNSLTLISGRSNSAVSKLGGKIQRSLNKANAPFPFRLRISLLTYSPVKLALVFVGAFSTSFIFVLGLILNTTMSNLIVQNFGTIDYNYSYSLGQDFFQPNDLPNSQFKTQITRFNDLDSNKEISSEEKLGEIIAEMIPNPDFSLADYWISCNMVDNKCWFENLPFSEAEEFKQLFNNFPKDPDNPQQFLNSGIIVFNNFVLPSENENYYQATHLNVINNDEMESSEFRFYDLYSLNSNNSKLISVENYWGNKLNTKIMNDSSYQWQAKNDPIPVAINRVAADLKNVGIGDTFRGHFTDQISTNAYTFIVRDIVANYLNSVLYVSQLTADNLVSDLYSKKEEIANSKNWIISQDNLFLPSKYVALVDNGEPFFVNGDFNTNKFSTPIYLHDENNELGSRAIEDIFLTRITYEEVGRVSTNALLIISLFCFFIGIIIVLSISNIISNDNQKIVFIMNTLGYSDDRINSMLVTIYTPLLIISTIGGAALSYYVMGIVSSAVGKATLLFIPNVVIWWQAILVTIAVVILFQASYYLFWQFQRRFKIQNMLILAENS